MHRLFMEEHCVMKQYFTYLEALRTDSHWNGGNGK